MEKKIKHRILGLLVIIGLIILLLPFFFTSSDLPSETVAVKAPPFPDQSVQVTPLAENTISNQPDDTIQPPPAPIEAPLPPVMPSPATTENTEEAPPKPAPAQPTLRSPIKPKKQLSMTSGWVIQVGSFKNKTNALRLVNRLRQKGYRAFVQTEPTSEKTKVFVGPQSKRALAHELANRIETDLHIRGFVMNYKPLTL